MLLKKLLRQLISFSKSEANGVLILFLLITFCLLSPAIYKSLFRSNYLDSTVDGLILDSLVTNFILEEKIETPTFNRLSNFDPNTIPSAELKAMGVPHFLSERIENYVNAGGSFKVKKDLLKIYGMTDSTYQSLKNFILLPDRIPVREQEVTISKVKRREKAHVYTQSNRFDGEGLIININEGDTSDFKKLYGIGTGYANRIVNFREALGGFHRVEQLRGMYGMTDTLYYQIRSFLTISDTVELKSLRINIATFKQLLAHPYISYELTQEILMAKSKYGKFKQVEDLSRLTKLSKDSTALLMPYISF